jgi:hypothetical protein
MSDDSPIDGEIIEGGDYPESADNRQDSSSFGNNFWTGNFELAPPPFGDLLINLRAKIGEQLKRPITQAEFGELLGDIDQVTISRWQRGVQKPQQMQLEKIVMLAHQYGITSLTLTRLQQSLNYDVKAYSLLDPRLKRLDALLTNEDEAFRDEFYEVVIGLLHMLKGVRRNRGL